MNYFKNRNLLIWVLVALLVVNISAIATIVYHVYFDRPPDGFRAEPGAEAPVFLKERLQFNNSQWTEFKRDHRQFRNTSRELFNNLHEIRKKMLEEVSNVEPDKAKLYKLADEYGRIHAELKKSTMDHFLEMKKDINPEQQERFNMFFRDLMHHEGAGPQMPMEERRGRMQRWRKGRP